MTHSNEELKTLRQKVLEKPHVEAKLEDLNKQMYDLEDKVRILKIQKDYEQGDVDRLEGRGLKAFFYTVVGKKEEKLSKERQEALAAAMKYDAGMRELEYVQKEIRRLEEELKNLSACEEQYEKMLKEKASLIKSSNNIESDEVRKLEEQIAGLESRKKEIIEALGAGDVAHAAAQAVYAKLETAGNYGTWDLFGGGIVSDIAKHSALDEAQELIEEFQIKLRNFKTELADVKIDSEMQLNIGEFLRFADYFFDGLVADWTVLKRITKAQDRVKAVQKQLDEVIDTLSTMYCETEENLAQAKNNLDGFITETAI